MNEPKKYWFKRRRYGYGWTPVTWQGWLAIGLVLVIIIGNGVLLSIQPPPSTTQLVLFVVNAVAWVGALVVVASLKGPRPKWRWGKKPHDNHHEDR